MDFPVVPRVTLPVASPYAGVVRLRRLRASRAIRRLVAETSLAPSNLVLPMFVREARTAAQPILSMPGVVQHSLHTLPAAVAAAAATGLGGVMLFGVPEQRDSSGSALSDSNGILNRAVTIARQVADGALLVQADLCLDEFTDHGHCGVLDRDGRVDNDATLARYQAGALAQARAGAEMLGLSGMMDGQVVAVRSALNDAGFTEVALLAYSAKYASAFYGPFRQAVESTLQGTRRAYQLDPANRREGRREAELDIAEGADVVMVKPAGYYLDLIADIAASSPVPVWAYQVSGEYSMIEAAAAQGWLDRRAAFVESVLSIRRAGADVVLSYAAMEIAKWISE